MNEFLGPYEILGGKVKPRLEGDTNIEKLDTIRKALGPVTIRDYDEKDDRDIPIPVDIDDVKDTWDCETILSGFFGRMCGLYMFNLLDTPTKCPPFVRQIIHKHGAACYGSTAVSTGTRIRYFSNTHPIPVLVATQ